jgi:hypothetical protein
MVGEGVEVIIGVSCDPQLGPVLLFGSGGLMVEVYNDVAVRRCPIMRSETHSMIAEVKGARLLQGFRGGQRRTSRHSRIPWCACRPRHALEGHSAESNINPLMVLPSGQGAQAVDPSSCFAVLALHVGESQTQKFAPSNCRQQRTALEPTTATQPWRREPLLTP